jgi:predicted permease
MIQDIRYSLRTLRKSPGFTIVAILTLALGIGANTAIFSVVQNVLLAPLPYFQPNRLVLVLQDNLALKHIIMNSYPDFLDWQRSARSFESMGAFAWWDYDLTAPGSPQHVEGRMVSAGFFHTLGVKPALGREFSADQDRHGGAAAVMLSDRLWRSRFGARPDVLGTAITLGGASYTVVGVLPPDFRLIEGEADVYTPLGQGDPMIFTDRTEHAVLTIARLKPGVTCEQAETEMSALQKQLDETYPAAEQGLGAAIRPLKQEFFSDVRGMLLMLLGAVGIVLLIACANVANLLLARSAGRKKEFAIRTALGAPRFRLVRQLITESLLLSLCGAALGLLLAFVALKIVPASMASVLPRGDSVGLNPSVLLFTLVISIAVGVLFGLAPALRTFNANMQSSLSYAGRGSTRAHYRAQNTLVVVQMALTLVLLVGAGLLFRSIRSLWMVDPGFDTQNVVTFKVGLSPSATKTAEGTRVAYQQLLGRIRQLPGIEAADVTVLVPLSQKVNLGPFWVSTNKPASVAEAPRALFYWTGPDYLRTMQIRLQRGRYFDAGDTTKSEPVVVVDEVLARKYFGPKDPVGQSMFIPHWGPVRVVGLVSHVRHWALDGRDTYTENQIYAPFFQLPDQWMPNFYPEVSIAVRTPLDVATAMAEIKAAVYGSGDEQTLYNVHGMRELVAGSMSSQRFPMLLLGAFAGLALLLASVGIYGVISYSMSQRIQEIGVRMALGADRLDILRMVIAEGLRLALTGILAGGIAALALTHSVSSFSTLLAGVGAADPVTFIGVIVLLTSVAALACYVPARRATRVDPMVALRYE